MNQTTYLERYRQVCEFEVEQTRRKGADYAGEDNVFKNFELIEVLTSGRVTASDGFAVRLSDKLQRVVNLLAAPAQVKNESILDTLIDASCYAKLWYLYLTRNEAELPLTQHGEVEQLHLFPESSHVNLKGELVEVPPTSSSIANVLDYMDEKERAGENLSKDSIYRNLLNRIKVGR